MVDQNIYNSWSREPKVRLDSGNTSSLALAWRVLVVRPLANSEADRPSRPARLPLMVDNLGQSCYSRGLAGSIPSVRLGTIVACTDLLLDVSLAHQIAFVIAACLAESRLSTARCWAAVVHRMGPPPPTSPTRCNRSLPVFLSISRHSSRAWVFMSVMFVGRPLSQVGMVCRGSSTGRISHALARAIARL